MKISKTTLNMAIKRGLEITIEEGIAHDGATLVCFWEGQDASEWMFSYRVSPDGLCWNGNIYLAQDVKEELPATITSEKQLRAVIDFVATNAI